jgi:hypothetical protein
MAFEGVLNVPLPAGEKTAFASLDGRRPAGAGEGIEVAAAGSWRQASARFGELTT